MSILDDYDKLDEKLKEIVDSRVEEKTRGFMEAYKKEHHLRLEVEFRLDPVLLSALDSPAGVSSALLDMAAKQISKHLLHHNAVEHVMTAPDSFNREQAFLFRMTLVKP